MEGVVIDPAFWRGKRVLVTGHTGFKGGWLSLWLQDLGAEVLGFALDPPTLPNIFSQAQVSRGMHSIRGNVEHLAAVCGVVASHRPEVVFHLAAQSLVRPSYEQPVETYATNVMGTVNVLEAVRQSASVRAALIVTSDKCYQNQEWIWGYRENEAMGGHDPYSSSKGCAELVTAAYRASFFDPDRAQPGMHPAAIATARAGNVIGGGDWARDRLVPDIIRSVSEARPLVLRNPDAVRPWQHVLEPLAGYLMLAQRLHDNGTAGAGAWNFGPAFVDCRPVRWIADTLSREWGGGQAWQLDEGPKPHEAHYLRLDSTKAISELGWRPRWDLATALHAIVEWHRAQAAGADMRQTTLQQIRRYAAS